jgi:hypothetical protein
MKSINLFLLFACLATAISCNKSSQDSSVTSAAKNSTDGGYTIPLNQCITQIFGTDVVQVCFDEVISDSRCPRKVQCIWAGEATVQLTVSVNGSPSTIQLSTMSPSSAVVDGFRIDFIDLIPYPVYGAPTPAPADIKAVVNITRI